MENFILGGTFKNILDSVYTGSLFPSVTFKIGK